MTGFPASLPGKRNLSKVRDVGMPLLSVVCVKPDQAGPFDVKSEMIDRTKTNLKEK